MQLKKKKYESDYSCYHVNESIKILKKKAFRKYRRGQILLNIWWESLKHR